MSAGKLNVHLLLIDCQADFLGNDDGSPYTVRFADGTEFRAALAVPGAVSDMKRLAALVTRIGHRVNDMHVTLDSHQTIHIANPGMWRDKNGNMPPPFTIILPDDIANDIWLPPDPALKPRVLAYAKKLAEQGNYPLCIWPEHCIIGTFGHNVYPELGEALQQWERREFANIDWVTKGSNTFTEHYGALMAEVPDPTDPRTQLNSRFLQVLQTADIIGVAGEASSHCVRETVRQIADNIGDEHLKKFYILEDCMSPVVAPGIDFPGIAKQFFAQMQQRGMQTTNSIQFLA